MKLIKQYHNTGNRLPVAIGVILISVLLFFSSLTLQAQYYYLERFNTQPNGATSDADNTPWTTIQGSSGSLAVDASFQDLTASSVGTEAVWESGSIAISGSTSISVDVLEYSNAEPSDYVKVYYKLDGSPTEVEFASFNDDFGSGTATTTVSGSSVVIVVRFLNDQEFHTIDNVVVESAVGGATLYSIADGDWDDGAIWSTTGYAGAACNCFPNGSTPVNIGNTRTVNLNVDAEVNDITIENTGSLLFTAGNVELNVMNDGTFTINSGGTFDENGQTNSDLDFEGGSGTSQLVVHSGSTFSIDRLYMFGANTLNISGDGDITLLEDFHISAAGTINNNSTGTFTIGDDLLFNDDNATFTNYGDIIITDDLLAGTGDDGNTFTNASGAHLDIGGDINLSGSNMTINNSGTLSQSGNFLNIGSSSSFNNLGGSFWFWGYTGGVAYDADMPNVFNAAGTVRYNGAGDQLVMPLSYNNLGIAGGGTKSLQGVTSVSGMMYLTNGFVALGDHNLTIGNSGSIANASSARYVVIDGNGSLIQNNIGTGGRSGGVLFPVGINTTSYTPLTINNSGTADNFTVRVCSNIYEEGGCATGTMQSVNVVDRTWFIDEAVVGGSSATLVFQWGATNELSGFDRADINIVHHNGAYWETVGNTSATGTGPYTASVSGVTSFSPFGVEDATDTPLPVELLFFNAKSKSHYVALTWETASELNNDFFTVERSVDLVSFTEVGSVRGKGTSHEISRYYLADNAPLKGKAYYRLRQTDFDGSFTYSAPVKVEYVVMQSDQLQVYPVPNEGDYINILNPQLKEDRVCTIHVIDGQGKKVLSVERNVQQGVPLLIHFKHPLSPGIYTLLFHDGELKSQAFIVK
ncbi:hypothetical protein C900_03131 [Fulvivirga imtechensis AK7]|uniref:Secretion system C-terminal sorting domain-containing protein n=1 Tax=Fulvivirga imtechensis AK7 TaxID=1237149 RepID=L8JPW4_9BACT|nr:hypothetical protein [Fulvivirga imtechensis]ELR71001.1 hypothetical protein C900_03131 [Fulvivirga imtechensis AK7]